TCTIDKANDGPENEQVCFTFKSVELSRDESDIATTAPVVIPTDMQPVISTADRPTKNQQSMLNVLEGFGPNGATTDEWNAKAKESGLDPKRRGDFSDWRYALKKKKLVHTYADRWYITHK